MSIFSLDHNLMCTIFSFIDPTEIIPNRRVCRTWEKLITHDPRWKWVTEMIQDRISVADPAAPKDDKFFLRTIRGFCAKAYAHFPDLFPQGKLQIVDNIPGALVALDSKKDCQWNLQRDLRSAFTANSLDKAALLLEKMRLIKQVPSLYFLQWELANALEKDKNLVPAVFTKMSMAACAPDMECLDVAIRKCVEYVPKIIEAMGQKECEPLNNAWLCCAMVNQPELTPLFLKAMKTGRKHTPTDGALAIATTSCSKYIPLILQAMQEGGYLPENPYVLESVRQKCPEYIDLLRPFLP